MDILNIARMGRAEQIALRDRLNALIDNPGADETPFRCVVHDEDRVGVDLSGSNHRVVIRGYRQWRLETSVFLSAAEARRLAARVLYLADQAEGVS
jgi:hypothetical protein